MNSDRDTLAGGVAPFGDPGITDRSHLPRAFRSVPRPSSPLSAKASTRCPYFALDHRSPRRRRGRTKPPRTGPNPTGPNPTGQIPGLPPRAGPAASHEDTSLGHRRRALPAPSQRRQIASSRGRHAAPAGRCPPRSQQLSLHPSINPPSRSPATGSLASPSRPPHRALPVVEVNGFEPMTSCLQSRRSPS